MNLVQVAEEIQHRIIHIFGRDMEGKRTLTPKPCASQAGGVLRTPSESITCGNAPTTRGYRHVAKAFRGGKVKTTIPLDLATD